MLVISPKGNWPISPKGYGVSVSSHDVLRVVDQPLKDMRQVVSVGKLTMSSTSIHHCVLNLIMQKVYNIEHCVRD